MTVIKPSRKIRTNDPTSVTYSRLGFEEHQLLFEALTRDLKERAMHSLTYQNSLPINGTRTMAPVPYIDGNDDSNMQQQFNEVMSGTLNPHRGTKGRLHENFYNPPKTTPPTSFHVTAY